MKKYNLSKIMKRAWELVKSFGITISDGLKKAWKEVKGMKIEMCVVGKETFVVDTTTGIVTGTTYHARDFLKDNFNAKWNKDSKQWTVDTEKFNSEMEKYSDYYKKYIVSKSTNASTAVKTIASKQLVNGNDGFYSIVTYTDGSAEKVFIG
nr:MAG TPA: hypothetical protein [Caudoviricetes sp.]